jgi:hypothetical protein
MNQTLVSLTEFEINPVTSYDSFFDVSFVKSWAITLRYKTKYVRKIFAGLVVLLSEC